MLSILNKLSLQKKVQNVATNSVILDKTKTKTTTTKQKIKHKNPCRIMELNPGPVATKADASPLHHRVN